MSIEKMEQALLSGNLDTCIRLCEEKLENNTNDIAVLELLSNAYYKKLILKNENDPEITFKTYIATILPIYKYILTIDPNYEPTLISILRNSLLHQKTAKTTTNKNALISENTKSEYLEYCFNLIKSHKTSVMGYGFLFEIYKLLNDTEHQLAVINKAVRNCELIFKHDRENLDKQVSFYFLEKIHILNNYTGFCKADLISLIRNNVHFLVSETPDKIEYLIEIAEKESEFELVGLLLDKLMDFNDATIEMTEIFVKWYYKIQNYAIEFELNENLTHYCLLIEKYFYKNLNKSHSYHYEHAKQIIQTNSNFVCAHQFEAIYLFEKQNFKDAFPVLKKALKLQPTECVLRCYIICYVKIYNKVPKIRWKNYSFLPASCYDEALSLDDFIKSEIKNPHQIKLLKNCVKNFYLISYNSFQDYFGTQKKFSSIYKTSKHFWAICCNNLAIILCELGEYKKAIAYAEEGLHYSDFWELHATISDAYMEIGDFENALSDLENYFKKSNNEVPEIYHLLLIARYLEIRYYLNASESLFFEAEEVLIKFFNFSKNNPALVLDLEREFDNAKTIVQAIFYSYIENEPNVYKIKIFKNQAIDFPKESNPHYMLMQFYNQEEDFSNTNKHASLYLQAKPKFNTNIFDKARVNYFLLKTFYMNKEYDTAIKLFTEVDDEVRKAFDDVQYFQWLILVIKTFVANGDYEKGIESIEKVELFMYDLKLYNAIEIENIHLLKAMSYKALKKNKLAVEILNSILIQNPLCTKANQLLKEWKKY